MSCHGRALPVEDGRDRPYDPAISLRDGRLKLARADIVINLVEVKKENWSFGNGEAQYA